MLKYTYSVGVLRANFSKALNIWFVSMRVIEELRSALDSISVDTFFSNTHLFPSGFPAKKRRLIKTAMGCRKQYARNATHTPIRAASVILLESFDSWMVLTFVGFHVSWTSVSVGGIVDVKVVFWVGVFEGSNVGKIGSKLGLFVGSLLGS